MAAAKKKSKTQEEKRLGWLDALYDEFDGPIAEIKDAAIEKAGNAMRWHADDFFSDIDADNKIGKMLEDGILELQRSIVDRLVLIHDGYQDGIARAKDEMMDAI